MSEYREPNSLDWWPDSLQPRAIPVILEELRGVRTALDMKPRVVDPAIRSRLGRRKTELKNELIEAERRLKDAH